MDFIENFRSAVAATGLTPPKTIVPSGKIQRFGKNNNSWYVLHSDFPQAGSFGDWSTGQKNKWSVAITSRVTPAELAAFKVRLESKLKEQDELAAEAKAEAKMRAVDLWNAGQPASNEHPYFVAKKIQPHHARMTNDGFLMIPVENSKGEITSLQYIDDSGAKRFLTSGEIKGCFTCIGEPTPCIYICEGFATGATLHEATNNMVVVGFNANNLSPVAKAIKKKYEHHEIVICADNDCRTILKSGKRNPGVIEAAKAAKEINATVAIPIFHSAQNGTDFNDMAEPDQINLALRETHAPTAPIINELTSPLVDDINALDMTTPFPDMSEGKHPRPLKTVANLAEICKRLGVVCRYDVIRKQEDLLIPNQSFTMDNKANASITWLKDWCERFGMPNGEIVPYVTALADRKPHNPVAIWIDSKPWDEVSRLQALFDTVKDRDPSKKGLKETLMLRWLVSAVAAVHEPHGIAAHGMLVFQGAQYSGKTAWFRKLVPQDMGLTADGVMLKPDDRDSIWQALSRWLIELGELDATFRKSDIAQLKAFVTRDKDVFRTPFMPKHSEFSRRTVFFASVNDEKFLQDPTGNRRFWTIACSGLDWAHTIDMQQLWAEVKHYYLMGERWALDDAEMKLLNASNEEFEIVDPVQEAIMSGFKWAEFHHGTVFMTATDALRQLGWPRIGQRELNLASKTIKHLNGDSKRRGKSGEYLLEVPTARQYTSTYSN